MRLQSYVRAADTARLVRDCLQMAANSYRKFAASLEYRGAAETLTHCGQRLVQWVAPISPPADRSSFDLAIGVNTDGKILLRKLKIPGRSVIDGNDYEPAEPTKFFALMARLKINYREFTFIDFGAGKGRALLMASRLSFKRLIGVELSPQLARVAEQNLAKCLGRDFKCKHAEIICMDAAEYALPRDKTVLYIYNTFKEELLQRVLLKIIESLRAAPRDFYIAYLNPVHAELFARLSRFEVVDQTQQFAIYRAERGRERIDCDGIAS